MLIALLFWFLGDKSVWKIENEQAKKKECGEKDVKLMSDDAESSEKKKPSLKKRGLFRA